MTIMTRSRVLKSLIAASCAVFMGTTATADEDVFRIHVQTHFAQGWSTSLMSEARELGVTQFRDGIYWSKVESTAGSYHFSSIRNYMAEAARNRLKPLP